MRVRPGNMSTIEITVNGQPRRVAAGATVADLLAELGLESQIVAVELNFQVVPRARHAQQSLQAGDRLEIVTLVGGG